MALGSDAPRTPPLLLPGKGPAGAGPASSYPLSWPAVTSPEDLAAVPVERLPGIPALAMGLAAGTPDVSAFLPDPWDAAAIATRAGEVLACFRPRDASRADSLLAEVAAGRTAGVFAGQQVGLFGGPLLTLVKALAAVRLSDEVAAAGVPSAPVFWCASEDHDLVEVTRFLLPGDTGVTDAGPDPVPLRRNRRPVGDLPVEADVAALLDRAAAGLPAADAEARAALLAFHSGRTYRSAFVATLDWLASEPSLRFADAARAADKPELVPLAARLVRERDTVRQLLAERNAALGAAGHPLQVTNDPDVLPLFAIVGGERFALREEGRKLQLKGAADEPSLEVEQVVANFASGAWLPSFSVLTRPLAASVLYPVAATILGPAEIAYWAQSRPLFAWAGILPPVIVPRPMVAPVTPPVRRALTRLGLGVGDALDGAEALLSRAGAGRAATALGRVRDMRRAALVALDALTPDLQAIDGGLSRAVEATRKNVAFSLEKLEEKAAQAAGRADDAVETQVRRVIQEIAPGGRLAERVYTAVPWLLRYGREGFVGPLKQRLRWNVTGLQVIEL
jgi:bacillithiol biosynthesis cysteine-adding enzyme BshC